MSQSFQQGDFLVFQLESGYGLLRLLSIEGGGDGRIWHLAGYQDLFPDVESAELATTSNDLAVSQRHMALTNRAFESTQVARIANSPLNDSELSALAEWQLDPEHNVSDRSVRLMLGLR
jgi:hypothetical protein